MNKTCVICDDSFDARGKAKTCSATCSKRLAAEWQLRKYYADPRYREYLRRSRTKAIAERKTDPAKRAAYQKYHREWQKKRAEADPAYRQMKQESSVRSRFKRLAGDPTFRDREREWLRNHHRWKEAVKAAADLANLGAELQRRTDG